MTRNKVPLLCLFLLAFFNFFSCSTTKIEDYSVLNKDNLLNVSQLCPSEFVWEEIEPGFSQTSFKIEKLGIKYHCIKIDLSNTKLSIIPTITDSPYGFKANKAASKTKAVVTVNTTPFNVKDKTQLIGITKTKGLVISDPVEKYCALGFYETENGYKATILKNQFYEEIEKVDSAFGGFYQILHNNQVDYDFKNNRRSRVSCGISSNSSYLYLLVSNAGITLNDRNGLTYPECALILQKMGCSEGMEFDGGHSTALCIYSKQVIKPYFQRKVPAVLGFLTN